ncbi:MAG: hypothetical protein AB8G11_21170 [Saprospiraceae bacterium]
MKNRPTQKGKKSYLRIVIWGFVIGLSISLFNPFILAIWIGIGFAKMGFYFSNDKNRPESRYESQNRINY